MTMLQKHSRCRSNGNEAFAQVTEQSRQSLTGWLNRLLRAGAVEGRLASGNVNVQISDFGLRSSRAVLLALKGERHGVDDSLFRFFAGLRSADDP